jgi:hypothetical protein
MYQFCTITTADHLYKTLALFDSLQKVHTYSFLHVLCVDDLNTELSLKNIAFYTTTTLQNAPIANSIITKYQNNKDKLRWSLKPVFMRFILENGVDKILYVDNDIYFFEEATFLFDLLNDANFLLTPHHYPRNPNKDQNWLEANYKVGLYNAGFIGANREAISTLQWWAECCAYRCQKSMWRGSFDDQKYLDLIPVMNERAHIVRHKGCNVADWNKDVISRTEKDGKVFLDKEYPLIFIHFNGTTVHAIQKGEEPFLKNAFDIYLKNLQKYKESVRPEQLYHSQSFADRVKYFLWKKATELGL